MYIYEWEIMRPPSRASDPPPPQPLSTLTLKLPIALSDRLRTCSAVQQW